MSSQDVISFNPVKITQSAQWPRAILLLAIAVCTYAHVPLSSGGRLLVPSFPTVALTPFLFLAVRRDLTPADVTFVLKVAFVLLLSIALSPGYAYIEEKFLGMIQFLMAIAVAVMIVRLMQQLAPASLERALLVLWCMIIVGSILEVLDVIRVYSDTFRVWVYEELYGLYDADMRDVNLVGWPRPKLFSEEPSHVTKFFVATVNAWLVVRVTWRKAVVVAGATIAMLVIMGSPMLLVSAAISVAIVAFNQRQHASSRVITLAVVLLVGAGIGAYIAGSNFVTAVRRVETVAESSVGAATGNATGDERRMVLPYVVLMDTILRSPLFGAGVGGKEVIADARDVSASSSTMVVGNNALAAVGIFLGIVGGTLFILLVFRQMRQTGVRRLGLMAVILLLFSQLIGGVDSFRYWGFVALFWGALATADASTDPDARVAGVNIVNSRQEARPRPR
jgi:hypothetical protein